MTSRATQLTEALLKKPPFRFLHDVVSEVQRNTGYALDLFDELEKNSANVKDKEAKVAYLTKIIDCVAIDSGERGTIARPLKIVAGLEPERTNAFLQALASCATKGDGGDAARRARNGEKNAAAADGISTAAKESAQTTDAVQPSTTSFDPFAGGTDVTRANAGSAGPSLAASRAPARDDVEPPTREKNVARKERPLSARRPPPKTKPPADPPVSPVADTRPGARAVVSERDRAVAGEEDSDSSGDDGAGLDEDPLGANPWSAARGDSGLPSKTGGALVRDMLAAKREGDASVRARAADAGGADAADGGGGGGIILGSRRRRKTAAASETTRGDDDEDGGTSLALGEDAFRDDHPSVSTGGADDASRFGSGRPKGGDDAARERADLDAARDVVQSLVRWTNPLGRAVDALAEDGEAMRVELRFWRRERAKHARRVKEARERQEKGPEAREADGNDDESARDASASAADDALAQTEADIARVAEKIQAARTDVAANDATIARLLAMVVTPS